MSDDPDAIAADAHGYVDDLLKACSQTGLLLPPEQQRREKSTS
jgi:hypothetical protein